MSQSFSKKRLIFIQIVNIVLTLGNNILLLEPDSVVERLEVLLRYDVVGVEVEDVVEEVPELVLLEGGQELLPCHLFSIRVIAGVVCPSVWPDCSLIT